MRWEYDAITDGQIIIHGKYEYPFELDISPCVVHLTPEDEEENLDEPSSVSYLHPLHRLDSAVEEDVLVKST